MLESRVQGKQTKILGDIRGQRRSGVGLYELQLKGGGVAVLFSENETEDKAVCSASRRPVRDAGGAEVVPAARVPERPERHHSQETLQASTKVRNLL